MSTVNNVLCNGSTIIQFKDTSFSMIEMKYTEHVNLYRKMKRDIKFNFNTSLDVIKLLTKEYFFYCLDNKN